MNLPIQARTDSYKLSHWVQYPPGTDRIYSYLESRGGGPGEVVFFGLQYYLERYLSGDVAGTEATVSAMGKFASAHGEPFNAPGWAHIVKDHGGRLPVSIRAVPEGTVVPSRNVLMTVENTCDRCFWLPNYLETLLVRVWYPSTVATLSRRHRLRILRALEMTGDPALVDLKLQDFGARGSTSSESAGIGAMAHLTAFGGSDTIEGIMFANHYYDCEMAGLSIPAAEHSTITSWGRDHEADAYRNMLEQYPRGPVSVVSDSYDVFAACERLWGAELRDRVLARDGVVVIRPDSGPPATTVVRVLNILWDAFGGSTNPKGYRVLDPHIRVIQGDGIDGEALMDILLTTQGAGFSADNLTFGSGGGLLQRMDRDTLRFAFKASAARVGGVWRDVFKDPVTDPGKAQKRGKLTLWRDAAGFHTDPYPSDMTAPPSTDELVEVFRDGAVLKRWSFAEVRGRARA